MEGSVSWVVLLGAPVFIEPASYSRSSSTKWGYCSASPRGAAGDGYEVPRERAVNLVFHAHCLLLLQVQIDPYLEDSMCQVCNAQPGPFFCRDQVRPVLLQLVLRGFLEEEQALLLGFGDIIPWLFPSGKDGALFWRRCSLPGEGICYLSGGPGRQCPTGFEPGVLQFAGAVPALGTSVGSTGAPEGRGGCCSVSHDELALGCMPLGLAEAQGTWADIELLQAKEVGWALAASCRAGIEY